METEHPILKPWALIWSSSPFVVIITTTPQGRLSIRLWSAVVGIFPFSHKSIIEVSHQCPAKSLGPVVIPINLKGVQWAWGQSSVQDSHVLVYALTLADQIFMDHPFRTVTFSCWSRLRPLSSSEGKFLILQIKNVLDNCVLQALWQQDGEETHMNVMVSCPYLWPYSVFSV